MADTTTSTNNNNNNSNDNSTTTTAATTPTTTTTLAQRRQRRSTSSSFNQLNQLNQQQQSSTPMTTRKSSSTAISETKSPTIKLDDKDKDKDKEKVKDDDEDNDDNEGNDNDNNDSTLSEELKQKNCRWSLTEPLEACDIQGNWYPAKIVEIKDDKVKIHFLRWKKRYDQWFKMDTNLIRPRSSETNNYSQIVHKSLKFTLNEEILARWTDQKYYPAKIIKFYSKGQYCLVLFYDGYRKKVKVSSLQKMPENYDGEQIPPPLPQKQQQEHHSIPTTSSSTSSSSATTTTTSSLSTNFDTTTTNNSFICDICQKGFRKESLLLQHKKHFHKTELDDVPSLVPPQLRIHKTNRHEKQKSLDSGDDIKVTKIKNENDNNEDNNNSNATSSATTTTTTVETLKRKLQESTPSPQSNDLLIMNNNNNKKIKQEHQDHQHHEQIESSVESPKTTTSTSKSMKSLTVVIPAWLSKRSTKPNTTLLFKDARLEAEEHENDNIEEFVKCICPLDEESGLMVQCELCLAWQHGSCAGFHNENDVPPSGYFCQFCRQAPKSVRTQKNSYQLNHWLKNGQPPQFQFINNNNNGTNEMIRNNSMNKFMDPMIKYMSGQQQQQQQTMNEGKSFILHDLTQSSTTNNDQNNSTTTNNEMKNENFFNTEIDHGHGEYYRHPNLDSDPEDNDDDEQDLQYYRYTNQLSSALYDCMVNLHALNYKIYQQKEKFNKDEIIEIEQQQRDLLINMDLIQQKLEKIEKDIEQKDSYAIHTSSSTLSATSPENYGIQSDISIPSVLQTSQQQSIKSTTNLFGITSSSNNNNNNESNDSMQQKNQTTSTSDCINNGNNNVDISNGNDQQLSNDQSMSQQQQPPLARLLLSTNGNNNNNNNNNSQQQQQNIDHNQQHRQHPSMAHDFLPVNLTDSEMKLELSYHYRDLQIARELVLLCNR